MTETKTNWTTYAYGIMTILVGFLGAPLTFFGGVLAASAATVPARVLGAGFIALAIAIQPIAWRRRIVGALFALAAIGCIGAFFAARASSGHETSGDVRFVGALPSATSPVSLLSELDQLFVATTLVDWFSEEDVGDTASLRGDVRRVHDEFEADFANVPSVLDDPMHDVCSGRSFVWPPPRHARDEAGAGPGRTLLVVHGYGGSWSDYLRVLRPVAMSLDATLVQPSCGMGRWIEERDLATFERFLVSPDSEHAEDRVDLVVLSNGGLAVSRRLDRVLEHAGSLVLISPIFDFSALAAASRPTRPIPVLVIHGDADARVPMAHVEAGVERLRRLRLDVRVRILPGAGHYAILHDRELIRRELESFYGDVGLDGARRP